MIYNRDLTAGLEMKRRKQSLSHIKKAESCFGWSNEFEPNIVCFMEGIIKQSRIGILMLKVI